MKDKTVYVTHRELEILHLLHEGFTDLEIAGRLLISRNTVRTHRQNLRTKFSAGNTTTMLRMAKDLFII